ncbi:SUMO protease ULP1 KNAG_0D02660 [Huiozyma naganishii CBS 8797]|uniref:Ubiquitin-like protease family profile domain-containing protein n=1 Tax=Huiozyma naganishii (strain ATCC MYA-139 / BCRC 22969 / CBS 8797 / KCTC 17520 / NBRC 10181 / NCYC 3082 / Yp74L-3) TaxID=1071383 RepID=J7R5A6_HUIN7|nr:hypothetical protein KNAG_0D02660 [Kazachstania naganishii CBS 8797]CCK70015.1 hypothetical protein KNAG_0D02660 [Kazachstania naganishii CBS 8797]
MSLVGFERNKDKSEYTPLYSMLSTHSSRGNEARKHSSIPSASNKLAKSGGSKTDEEESEMGGTAHGVHLWNRLFSRLSHSGKTNEDAECEVPVKDAKRQRDQDTLLIPRKKKRPANEAEMGIEPKRQEVNDKKLNLSKDPFGWNKWETTEIGSSNKKADYGTTFFKRKTLTKYKNGIDDADVILRSESDELACLREIFNGEYCIPKVIADERKHQLQLLNRDKQVMEPSSTSKWRNSVVMLTEKIRNILLLEGHTSKESQDNDVVFVKEKKIPSLEEKRQRYHDNKKLFDKKLSNLENEFKNYRELTQERRRIQESIRQKRESAGKANIIPTLKEKDLRHIQSTLERKDAAVLYNKENIEVGIRDFKTLAPRRWLNDTIIEFFMKFIENNTENTVAFNSFFYTSLSERGYQGVRRWMKRKKVTIDKLDKIFVPINLKQSHWALGLIDLRRERIVYVDSLTNGPSAISFAILNDLKIYISEESGQKIGENFQLVHADCPQQPNGFDCGIYVCMNTLYLSTDSELTFSAKDAVKMRYYIAGLILSGGDK